MTELLEGVKPFFRQITLGLDLILVYLILYRVLLGLKRTHAFRLVKGFLFIVLVFSVSFLLNLTTIKWIVEQLITVVLVFVIIIFQPELRRFLERIGATGKLFSPLLNQSEGQSTIVIRQILRAVETLSKEKIGALIAIEVSTNLSDYIESGIKIKAEVSTDLLAALFWPGSPTHDGATVLCGNNIEAAGCLLPLTESRINDRRLGTRHRAALGLSEVSDAIIIIVSEETGVISLAENGVMTRFLTKEALETRLFNLYKES